MRSWFDVLFRSGNWVREDRYQLLEETPVFRDLSPSDYRQIAELLHETRYSAGERIFTEGDPSSALYLVKEGTVTIFREGPDEQREIQTFSEGGFFGELALCKDHRRTASAEAGEECVLLGMFRQELVEFMRREADSGVRVLLNLVEMLSDRLLEAHEEIESLKAELEV